MESRLVPVEQVFARFPRMIRDLAQRQKKEIAFVINGGEIELDRTIVDKLGEPLVHLLRNAVDHGISNKGTIKLEAQRKSEHVLFIIENDEHGINLEKVKLTVIKKNLASAQEVALMSEQQLVNFLFDGNFSTNDEVTEISGRGVGLSVVKKFIESFGGRVIVENFKDRVRFILELPLTLAIIETLLISVNDAIFAIPFSNVDRSVHVPMGNIKRMGDHNMAVVDGRNIPLIDLKEVFQLAEILADKMDKTVLEKASAPNAREKGKKDKESLVVLVKMGTEMGGILVDKILSEQEIIVKPFSSVLKNIKSFSGSTILGNGRVVLILDVMNILKKAK
jgi:two-component system chemotaxis sensor kinase CheA